MRVVPDRPLRLIDIALLVAGAALGFRTVNQAVGHNIAEIAQGLMESRGRFVYATSRLASLVVVPMLATLAVAGLASGLWPPRPPRKRLFQQPGVLACLVATLTIGTERGLESLYHLSNRKSGHTAADELRMCPFYGFHAIAYAWLSLALIGRWRPSRSFPDRLGRAIGFAWIACWLWIRAGPTLVRLLG